MYVTNWFPVLNNVIIKNVIKKEEVKYLKLPPLSSISSFSSIQQAILSNTSFSIITNRHIFFGKDSLPYIASINPVYLLEESFRYYRPLVNINKSNVTKDLCLLLFSSQPKEHFIIISSKFVSMYFVCSCVFCGKEEILLEISNSISCSLLESKTKSTYFLVDSYESHQCNKFSKEVGSILQVHGIILKDVIFDVKQYQLDIYNLPVLSQEVLFHEIDNWKEIVNESLGSVRTFRLGIYINEVFPTIYTDWVLDSITQHLLMISEDKFKLLLETSEVLMED